ncbi:acetylglutamate kinase [human gut metagenome]|uniref:Acetylglutamate kinase n=1 Tax=human gut metagenome TaxID=408170 RepID=K1UFP8_9ZZZZ
MHDTERRDENDNEGTTAAAGHGQMDEKGDVLIEALPYIQRFNRKIIVVKYGGSAMLDENFMKSVIQDITLLKLVGFKPIIVHGGGKAISRHIDRLGMETQFINGLRVTDEDTLEAAEMVLNSVNKKLVQIVEQLGVRAIGISGKDGRLLTVRKIIRRSGHWICWRSYTCK